MEEKKRIIKKRKSLKRSNKKIGKKNQKSNKKKFKKDINKVYRAIFLSKIIIIIVLSIIFQTIYKKYRKLNKIYKYCLDCVNRINNLDSKCLDCSNDLLFKELKIVSTKDTLDEIIKNKRSISRFSDGEFSLIYGEISNFQEYNQELSKRLLEIIGNNHKNKNLLVGIDFAYKKKELDLYINYEVHFWTEFYKKNKFKLLKILNLKRKYYSSDITRFYFKYKDKSHVPKYISKLKKIWEGRDILIIEGEKTRVGIGNDLLNNSKSIKRIICPAKHAFRVYDKIIESVSKVSKDILVLIALGPTASVLAFDLTNLGYQAVDIGHADLQYELYLRNATGWMLIPYKFVNEYNFGRDRVDDVKDPEYYKQIFDKILY